MTDFGVRDCYLHHIGTAVPERWLDGEQSVEVMRRACRTERAARMLPRVARLTGIERRYLAALEEQDASGPDGPFYRDAAEQPHGPGMSARTRAFDRRAGALVLRALAGIERDVLARVEVLVTVSCTHASSPGLERPILTHTPVPPTVDRWNLGFMGCSAGLAALRLAHQARANARSVLIAACELSSIHFQYTDELDQMTANLLFADGAAAVLVRPEPAQVRVCACRCVALPAAAEQMVWFAGDHGLELRLSPDLPETLAAHLPEIVSQFVADCGVGMGEVSRWLVHPGGPQILDAVERCLRLPADALRNSRDVLRRFGNMSSPTIFFILKECLAAGTTGHVLAIAFGPGLTIELVLLTVADRRGPAPPSGSSA